MPLDTASIDFTRTGPDTLGGRYLRHQWQPVFLARELAAGQAVPIRVMGEDFTLFRGESGDPHIVAHRCPHRGAQLSAGWVAGDSIHCGYHGWRFSPTGQCVEQPGEPRPFCDKIRIAAYPAQERFGLVFAHFGAGAPPPLTEWPELADCTSSMTRFPCNYFQSMENIVDDVHVNFAHRGAFVSSMRRTIPRISAEETPFGLTQFMHHPDRTDEIHFVMPNQAYLSFPVPSREDLAARRRTYSGYARLGMWYVPIDDTSHHLFVASLWLPDRPREHDEPSSCLRDEIASILEGRKRLEDYARHPKLILLQDGVQMVGQGPLHDRSMERLGTTDAGVIRLRKIWLRELALLEQGHPPTTFVRPDAESLQRYEDSDRAARHDPIT